MFGQQKHAIDIFSFMPITFIFDLKDETFLDDLKGFVKYFSYLEVMNELVAQGRFGAVQEESPDGLVRSLEDQLYHRHRDSLAKTSKLKPAGNLLKTGKLAGPLEVRQKTEEVEQLQETKTVAEQPAEVSQLQDPHPKPPQSENPESDTADQPAKQPQLQAPTDVKPTPTPVAPKKTDHKPAPQERRKSNLPSAPQPTDPEQIENDKTRKLLDRLKNPVFQIDTYCLPVVKSKSEVKLLIDYSKFIPDNCAASGKNIWIIKVAGMNRGFGVEVFQTLEELRKLIKDIGTGYQERIVQDDKQISRSAAFIKTSKFVIQKYIERPLLFKGRKMDLRVWVMFSHENKPYVFRECYVRLSSAPFKTDKLNEKFVHLTNNALQKYSEQYDEDETLKSVPEWEAHLKAEVRPDYDFKRDTWPSIRRIIKITHACCAKQVNLGNKKVSFEVFGYDFMMDENFKVWLIETNTNPSITTPGVILKAYVPRMIDDAFRLTLDKVFPPREYGVVGHEAPEAELQIPEVKGEAPQRKRVFPMPGYGDHENLWELIDEKL